MPSGPATGHNESPGTWNFNTHFKRPKLTYGPRRGFCPYHGQTGTYQLSVGLVPRNALSVTGLAAFRTPDPQDAPSLALVMGVYRQDKPVKFCLLILGQRQKLAHLFRKKRDPLARFFHPRCAKQTAWDGCLPLTSCRLPRWSLGCFRDLF
jgi:hypothetical protein